MEIKRIMLAMREREITKIMKCPLYSKLKHRRSSEHLSVVKVKEDKTVPLKEISK